MKNLFEKLKPEIRLAIENDMADYPASTTLIINALKGEQYINNLRYTFIIDIERYYRDAYKCSPNSAWDCIIN